jgi:23S rRNA pseudouridine1911/1915/1917 synthase
MNHSLREGKPGARLAAAFFLNLLSLELGGKRIAGLGFHMEKMQILYEDNHLIAVHKPGGVLVQGDVSRAASLMDMVKDYIKKKHNKPGKVFLGLVHRLDRPVSGVVVFARTSKSASRLSMQWRQRSITKIYWALVHGKMPLPSGRLISYLKKRRKVSLGKHWGSRLPQLQDTF